MTGINFTARPLHAVVAGLVVIIVALGAFLGVRALTSTRPGPTTTVAPPTTSTAPPSTTAAAPLPPASPSFASLSGTWSRHDTTGLTINATGAGHVGLPDYSACPACSAASAPTNTIAFRLTMTSGGRATGHVTSVTDSSQPVTVANTPVSPGDPVEVVPVAGDQLQLSIGGSEISTFCGRQAAPGACGA
ncbi:MAG: hypothetical protein J2O39_02140 [Acidimicrobiales bacterium]|nr:hypothetical protein [Acidimicrobiales bacterium]MBO0893150.1 hypothetical protein [Acidimicrobiales bacterium]